MKQPDRIELVEYTPAYYPKNHLSEAAGEYIWQKYGKQVTVEFPNVKTNHQWQFTSLGWVGYLPVTSELGVALLPKVPLANLFRMLEYAYRLDSFKFLDGLTSCESLQEFYERIANILALRVLDRAKKGYYRAYIDFDERLNCVRGRLDVQKMLTNFNRASFPCEYQEHQADIKDNQILVWTLHRIMKSGLCSERILPTVKKAYRSLHGHASLEPCYSQECVRRLYNRLNQDYEPLHALCRFFLDQSGPSHNHGDYTMLPFLVDMARLFELFVAEWLKSHLPSRYELKSQEHLSFGENGELKFNIDLVIYDRELQKVTCVLDTKYKTHSLPASADVAQVVTYAVAKDCQEAILLYPSADIQPFDQHIGDIRVRTAAFSIQEDIETAGEALLKKLSLDE